MGKNSANELAALAPELSVTDLGTSLKFWCDVLGFKIRYQSPGFVYLERGAAQVMLEEHTGEWVTAPLEKPFGRGFNLKLIIDNVDLLVDRLTTANWPLFRKPKEVWYSTGDEEIGYRQFLVQDPDGYLLRFSQDLGTRPHA